jgi:hypothetical protein
MRLGLLLVLTALLPLTACSDDREPLQLGGYGNVLDPQDEPPYFMLHVCIPGDDAQVTITDVQADHEIGAREPVRFEVAFDDSDATGVVSGPQPAPGELRDAVGAVGTVPTCDGDRSTTGPATLAILFPTVGDEPVIVDGVNVTYEVDGDERTAHSTAFLVQCPPGTRAGGSDGRPCPPAR